MSVDENSSQKNLHKKTRRHEWTPCYSENWAFNLSGPATDRLQWIRSSYQLKSGGVEIIFSEDNQVVMRNGSDQQGPTLRFTLDEFDSFINGQKPL